MIEESETVQANNSTIAKQVEEIEIGEHSEWTEEKANVIRVIDEERAAVIDNCATQIDFINLILKERGDDAELTFEECTIVTFLQKRPNAYAKTARERIKKTFKKEGNLSTSIPIETYDFSDYTVEEEIQMCPDIFAGFPERNVEILEQISMEELKKIRSFRDHEDYLQHLIDVRNDQNDGETIDMLNILSNITDVERVTIGYIRLRNKLFSGSPETDITGLSTGEYAQ